MFNVTVTFSDIAANQTGLKSVCGRVDKKSVTEAFNYMLVQALRQLAEHSPEGWRHYDSDIISVSVERI